MNRFRLILLFLCTLTLATETFAQQHQSTKRSIYKINGKEFYSYSNEKKSNTLVILFHDWFGVTDLSYEMLGRLGSQGYSGLALDLYEGKSAATHQDAWKYMNSVDTANVKLFIDQLINKNSKKYDKIILWGFSMGTTYAAYAAIRNKDNVDGLIVFYGDVPKEDNELAEIDFPSMMVMGSSDNPAGAIDFFNGLTSKEGSLVTLNIYPNIGHAFAQKLFNQGKNYNEAIKEAAMTSAFNFIENEVIYK